MIISLIGMSGVGKTFWSKKLEYEAGYIRIGCDELIGESFAKKLQTLNVKTDLNSIAQWRGMPYETRYRDNEALQIQNEQEVMEMVCDRLEQLKAENVVVDTSGSLVYVDERVLRRLRDLSRCVYIVAGKEQVTELYNYEVIFRRPLVWGQAYKSVSGESSAQAMRRCFSELIEWRAREYGRWASSVIYYRELRDNVKNIEQFQHLVATATR